MYLIYADESGDPGNPGDSKYFVISGLIVHETHWNGVFSQFIDLRRSLHAQYRLPFRAEFHATDLVGGHGDYHHTRSGLTPVHRLEIYQKILECLAATAELRILNVFVRKERITAPDMDIYEMAWRLFIQRCHNFVEKGGHLNLQDQYGLLITDSTHDDALRRLMRRMRAYNPVPSTIPGNDVRHIRVTRLLDDPVPRISGWSYFIQMADLVAYALAHRDFPRKKLAKYGFEGFFDCLGPILLREACRYDPQGIVYWPR